MISLRIVTLCIVFLFRWRFPKNKRITEIIEKNYGRDTVKKIRKFEKTDYKRRKIDLDLNFLHTCVENDVIPKFCTFKTANRNLRSSQAYTDCQKKLLKEEIKQKELRKNSLEEEFLKIEKELLDILLYIDFVHVSSLFINGNKSSIKKIEHIQNIKLEELIGLKQGHDPKQVIYNYSSYTLSEHETSLLTKGLDFALPPKNIKFDNHLLPFELLYRDISNLSVPNEKLICLKYACQTSSDH